MVRRIRKGVMDMKINYEHFSHQEADDLADFLDCLCQNSVPEYLLPAYERFTNILRALTNDSDACIVTAG